MNWRWVRDWTGKIFLACIPLGTFIYLSATPVIRPGGVIETLPQAILVGLVIAAGVAAVSAGVLALRSARGGGARPGTPSPGHAGRDDEATHDDDTDDDHTGADGFDPDEVEDSEVDRDAGTPPARRPPRAARRKPTRRRRGD